MHGSLRRGIASVASSCFSTESADSGPSLRVRTELCQITEADTPPGSRRGTLGHLQGGREAVVRCVQAERQQSSAH